MSSWRPPRAMNRIEQLVEKVPHARTVVHGETTLSEVAHFLVPKPVVSGISEGTIVELVAGPFKGEKAVVKRIDTGKEEITVELYESVLPIPITVRGDNVRVVDKGDGQVTILFRPGQDYTFKSLPVNLSKPRLCTQRVRHGDTMAEVVEVLVAGGKATAGPPIGPALGPLGINVKAVVDEINKKTGTFNGMQVPVKIEVDDKKNFTVTVGIPPTTALIKKEANIEKGSAEPSTIVVGNLPLEAAVSIARMKQDDMLSYDLKTAVKEVVGTCVSMGVTVDGKKPKEVIAAINAGDYDKVLAV